MTKENIMGKLASLITAALPLLFGLSAVAQAGAPTQTCEYAVLECKSNKKGDFLVVAFSNDRDNAPSIDVGDECTQALDRLDNDASPNFIINRRWIASGSQDRTVYTAVTGNCD
jgi:hypothetical protein